MAGSLLPSPFGSIRTGNTFPPFDDFDYPPGPLVGQGGWTAGMSGSPTVIAGGITTDASVDAFHSVLSAALNINGPWTVSVVFKPSGSSDSCFLGIHFNDAGTMAGYLDLTLVYNCAAELAEVFADFSGFTTTPGPAACIRDTSHTLQVIRTFNNAITIKLDGVTLAGDSGISIGNLTIADFTVSLGVDLPGIMLIESVSLTA